MNDLPPAEGGWRELALRNWEEGRREGGVNQAVRGEAEKVRAGVGEIVGAATYYFDQYRIMILLVFLII